MGRRCGACFAPCTPVDHPSWSWFVSFLPLQYKKGQQVYALNNTFYGNTEKGEQ